MSSGVPGSGTIWKVRCRECEAEGGKMAEKGDMHAGEIQLAFQVRLARFFTSCLILSWKRSGKKDEEQENGYDDYPGYFKDFLHDRDAG